MILILFATDSDRRASLRQRSSRCERSTRSLVILSYARTRILVVKCSVSQIHVSQRVARDITLPELFSRGRRLCLYGIRSTDVNPTFGRYVEKAPGLPMEESASDELLQRLYSQSNFPEYQCFFRYESGSMAFWDNRACMHRASVDFSSHARVMRRVTIQGDAPFYDPHDTQAAAARQERCWKAEARASGAAPKL